MSSTYEIPTKPYDLQKTRNPIEEIYRATNNFKNISTEAAFMLINRLTNRLHDEVVYGQFNAPDRAIAALVNGNGGAFLKKTVFNKGVYFIWYDMSKGIYLFWGPSVYKVCDAMNLIRSRIVMYVPKKITPAEPKLSFTFNRESIAATPPPKEEFIPTIHRSISMLPDGNDDENLSEFELNFIDSCRKKWVNDPTIAELLCRMDKGHISKFIFVFQAESYMENRLREKLELMEKKNVFVKNIKI